jgi:hypothetical protein
VTCVNSKVKVQYECKLTVLQTHSSIVLRTKSHFYFRTTKVKIEKNAETELKWKSKMKNTWKWNESENKVVRGKPKWKPYFIKFGSLEFSSAIEDFNNHLNIESMNKLLFTNAFNAFNDLRLIESFLTRNKNNSWSDSVRYLSYKLIACIAVNLFWTNFYALHSFLAISQTYDYRTRNDWDQCYPPIYPVHDS